MELQGKTGQCRAKYAGRSAKHDSKERLFQPTNLDQTANSRIAWKDSRLTENLTTLQHQYCDCLLNSSKKVLCENESPMETELEQEKRLRWTKYAGRSTKH